MKMAKFRQALYVCLVLSVSETESQDLQHSVEELCLGRPSDEFFRLATEGDCRDVVRCDSAGPAGTTRLASIRCPSGLAFDLNKQICNWKAKVIIVKHCKQDQEGLELEMP